MNAKRWIAGACLIGCLTAAATATAQTHPLTLRVRDAQTGLSTAARVHFSSGGQPLLDTPDASIPTHYSPRLDAYVHVLDSLTVDLPAGTVDLVAVRGTEGVATFDSLELTGATTHTVFVDDWIDAKAMGWYAGDPHVHADHSQGAQYPPPSMEHIAKAARAEGLDVMALLDNLAAHPGGPVVPPFPGVTLMWGEEYRAAFWGHVVLLGLDALVLEGQSAGCCNDLTSVWPTLEGKFETLDIPLVYVAHPQTTTFLEDASNWPGGGHARELRSLALGDEMHGVAVAGASMDPGPWATGALLDVLRAGARWAAVGEGDRPLDRFFTSAPGMPRTYAHLPTAPAPGDTALARAWIDAVRARRCFASTGPILHTVTLDGVGMGGTVSGGGTLDLSLGFESLGRIEDLWVHDSAGTPLHWNWPGGRTSLDTTLTWTVAHDDFVVVEIAGPGDDWPAVEYDPRAVSSPIWIDAGSPWPWSPEVARRGADELERVWEIALIDRFFDDAAESVATREDILGSSQDYEDAVDDPPADIVLLEPSNGELLFVTSKRLDWSASFSYDAEALTYRLKVARDAGFAQIAVDAIATTNSYQVEGLEPGTTYHWRVEALEPIAESVLALNAPFSFTVDETAVAVAIDDASRFALLPGPRDAAALGVMLELGRGADVRIDVIDVRGRRVRQLHSGWLDAGSHPIRWHGRDDAGAPVARGVYWFLASSNGRQTSAKTIVIR